MADDRTYETDQVLVRRARIQRWVDLGQRTGYLCIAVAVVAFGIALFNDLTGWAVTVTIAALVGSIATLPAAIVFGYAVKAAEREERADPRLRR